MQRTNRVTIRFDEDELHQLHFLCQEGGRTPSDLIRLLIGSAATQNGFDRRQSHCPIATKQTKNRRVTLRFTDAEWGLLEEGQRAHLFATLPSYITSILRNATYGVSFLPAVEICELQKIQSELGSIGRNMNQIARRVNADWREGTPELLKEAIALAKEAHSHNEYIQKMLERAMNRHFQA